MNQKPLHVVKFGGTSVSSVKKLQRIADYLASLYHANHQLIAVVSAMGHYTNELLALGNGLSSQPVTRELDMLVTSGERITAALLSICINERGIKAISLTGSQCGILTDSNHGNARIKEIKGERIQQALDQHKIVIVAGFQGVCPETKEVTTLGRGGSDLTAIALAAKFKAEGCHIFTDVDGVLTANPKVVPEATRLEKIHWETMIKAASTGAEVVHLRAAQLAAAEKIPYTVRPSHNLKSNGTLINGETPALEQPVVKILSYRENLTFFQFTFATSPHPLVEKLTQWAWEQDSAIYSSQLQRQPKGVSWSGCLATRLFPEFRQQIASQFPLQQEMSIGDQSLISMIGYGFLQSPQLIGQVMQLTGNQANFSSIDNELIQIAVPSSDSNRIINLLHQL